MVEAMAERHPHSEEPTSPDQPAASWQLDPFQRHQHRWWDGTRWSSRVRDGASIGIDPPVIDPKPEAALPARPASPIDDAVVPLPTTNWATIAGLVIGVIVIAGLVLLAVASI